MATRGEVTNLLIKFRHGDADAAAQLFPIVYDELHRIAQNFMRKDRPGHMLQATAVLHEAYLRLAAQDTDIADRTHFFALAANQMRRVLVDHARGNLSQKRGSGNQAVDLREGLLVLEQPPEIIHALDEALNDLAQLDPRQASIVEMRFFGGMTEEEIGLVMGISSRTVKRDWQMARKWLELRLRPS